MQPRDLTEASFQLYPPLGRKVAVAHLGLLRELPLVLDAILLHELLGYDTSFPAERSAIDARFTYLEGLSPDSRQTLTSGFANLKLSPGLMAEDWARSPRKFEEDLNAHLWATHQMDAFRSVGEEFVHKVVDGIHTPNAAAPRLVVVAVPGELYKPDYTMFRKLVPNGTLFLHVESAGGMIPILQRLAQRADKTPVPYGHWYIDGDKPERCPSAQVCNVSWAASEPTRTAVLNKVQSVIGSGSAGPEMLRSVMAGWDHPAQGSEPGDPLLDAFVQRVYGEGAGTQIFSTTFVQWSAREILKRAEPVTLVARFGARQRQRSMNEMFAASATEMDFAGSAVDADFAAYYTWINLQRLPGKEKATFIAWSQHDGRAVAIGPGFPRGAESAGNISMEKLLGLVAQG